MTGASTEGEPKVTDEARAMAESLLEAHAPRKPEKRGTKSRR